MFRNISEIVETAKATGSHFFDADSMRYFSSRVHGDLYGGRFFVTSERDNTIWGEPAWNGVRRYTVRMARYYPGDERLQIDTMGEFGEYDTREEAHREARRLGDTVESCADCGAVVIPGEHSGHRAHFTGAWYCHDCGAYCEGGEA